MWEWLQIWISCKNNATTLNSQLMKWGAAFVINIASPLNVNPIWLPYNCCIYAWIKFEFKLMKYAKRNPTFLTWHTRIPHAYIMSIDTWTLARQVRNPMMFLKRVFLLFCIFQRLRCFFRKRVNVTLESKHKCLKNVPRPDSSSFLLLYIWNTKKWRKKNKNKYIIIKIIYIYTTLYLKLKLN